MRVYKPWGREEIFAVTDKYAGKVIIINYGCKLSLQYHRYKHETIYVFRGLLRVTLGEKTFIAEDGDSIEIAPLMSHRFEAISSDVILFEVSTPELEDIVRIEDDYRRESNGN